MTTKTVKKTLYAIGDRSGDVARSIGSGTADLARRIGPRRGLIGLGVLVVAVGGSIMLVRYLRARADERELHEADTGKPVGRAKSRNRVYAEPNADSRMSY